MKRSSLVLSCTFIVLTFLTSSFAKQVIALDLGSDSKLSASNAPGDLPKRFTQIEIESYMRDYSVTQQEAIRRLELLSSVGRLNYELMTGESETFGGLWVQHSPEFEVYVNVAEDGRRTLEERLQNHALASLIRVNEVSHSLTALRAIAERARREFALTGIQFDHDINIPENRVEIYVMNSVLRSRGAQFGVIASNLGSSVEIVGVEGLSRETVGIQGGRGLNLLTGEVRCTTGFTVLHFPTGRKGVVTAGHCANSLKYDNKRVLVFQAEVLRNIPLVPYDVQWHTSSSLVDTFRPYISTGSRSMAIYGVVYHAYQYVGRYVCKYGITTKSGCGTIVSTNFNTMFIRVHSDISDLSEPGDSGGPWYNQYNALGIMIGDIEPGNDAYYMAAEYVSVLNLGILTTN